MSESGPVTRLRLTHVGGPTVLAEVGDLRILTDPTFDPPGKRYRFGWGTASTKVAGPAVPLSELGRVDVVLLTHDQHADNLDDAGRDLLASAGLVLTTRSGAGRLGGDARGLRPWQSVELGAVAGVPVTVTATPCRHGPPLSRRVVGDVVGFAVSYDPAVGALWFSGDTVLYPGVRQVAERIDVDVAVLHVGAVRFPITGPARYTMSIEDAIELSVALRPRIAVPVHFEGWSHFSEAADAIERRLHEEAGPSVAPFRLLPAGVAVDVSPPSA